MQEWLNWTVSKTVVRATAPWVRIPLSPPFSTRERKGGNVLAVLRREIAFFVSQQVFSVHTPSMYKDIISYQLADEVTEEHLLRVADQIVESWMTKQPGFIKWEIHKNNAGGYTDIVYWNSKADAKRAESEMTNIPNANDWYECYKDGSIESTNLDEIRSFE